MSNDQIKKVLLSLRKTEHDFTVILSGKKSRKVHGLYKPDSREIIIHNRNFKNDNELMYTAIHEYAHHLQFTTSATPDLRAHAHHRVLEPAPHAALRGGGEGHLLATPSRASRSSARSPGRSASKFLAGSGTLMKELGRLLVEAHELCEKHGTSYSDYLDRVLGLPRTSAQRHREGAHAGPRSPGRVREHAHPRRHPGRPGARAKAQEELRAGHSPDMVKAKYGPTPPAAGSRATRCRPSASASRRASSA